MFDVCALFGTRGETCLQDPSARVYQALGPSLVRTMHTAQPQAFTTVCVSPSQNKLVSRVDSRGESLLSHLSTYVVSGVPRQIFMRLLLLFSLLSE